MPLPCRWLTSMMAEALAAPAIDCGEGTQVALKEKDGSPKPIDTEFHLFGYIITRTI